MTMMRKTVTVLATAGVLVAGMAAPAQARPVYKGKYLKACQVAPPNVGTTMPVLPRGCYASVRPWR